MSVNEEGNKVANKKAPAEVSGYKSLLTMDNTLAKRTNASNKANLNKAVDAKGSKGKRRSRSRSPLRKDRKEKKESINYDIPDKSYGDFYCKACDSHMNSEDIWEMHLQGKRHLKNTKSSSEEWERKYDYVNEDPEALSDIEEEKSPIVGLQHVCEMQRLEQKPIYSCFLCNATIPNSRLLIDHLLGLKHRLAFLKEHDPERYHLIHESNIKKGQIEPVVEECVAKHEFDSGRGKMIVKRERGRPVSTWGGKKLEKEKEYRRSYPVLREDMSNRKRSSAYHSDRSESRSIDYGHGRGEMYTSAFPETKFRETNRNDHSSRFDRPFSPEILGNKYLDRSYNTSATADRMCYSSDSQLGDLREVLEKKKTPNLDSSIPDEALGIISALPTISFLQLVLFKLDNLKIEDKTEIECLDRVVNRATTLAMNVKSKMLTPSLRMQFKESMAQNGLDVDGVSQQSLQQVQNLFQMVGDLKALSSSRTPAPVTYPNANPLSATNYIPPQRSFSQTSSTPSYQTKSYTQPASNSQTFPNPSLPQQNPHLSRQNPSYASGYSSTSSATYPSSSCAIPGLTLTQESPEKNSSQSPFDQLEAQAKSIFGQWGPGR